MDGSDDTTGNRIINISVQIPGLSAFYWETIDTKTASQDAVGYVSVVEPVLLDLLDGDTSKVNGLVTDTNSTMRSFHREMAKRPGFSHVFYTLCDSHGFQLLIKDIVKAEPYKTTIANVSKITTWFKKSKLQLAFLRQHQLRAYGKKKALVASVITRWGTQLQALHSVLGNKEALLAWARDGLTVQKTPSRSHAALFDIIGNVKNHVFWREVEVLATVLGPIGAVQERSESDKLNVGHTLMNWRQIAANWCQLRNSGEWLEVDWDPLFTKLASREEIQTLDIHVTAWALDPTTRYTSLSIQQLTCVEAFLQEFSPASSWPKVRSQFTQFRAQDGPHFSMGSATLNSGETPYEFWLRLSTTDLELAHVAKRILSTLANSVPSERSFSATKFLQNKVRNRLTPETTNHAAFLFINAKVL